MEVESSVFEVSTVFSSSGVLDEEFEERAGSVPAEQAGGEDDEKRGRDQGQVEMQVAERVGFRRIVFRERAQQPGDDQGDDGGGKPPGTQRFSGLGGNHVASACGAAEFGFECGFSEGCVLPKPVFGFGGEELEEGFEESAADRVALMAPGVEEEYPGGDGRFPVGFVESFTQ